MQTVPLSEAKDQLSALVEDVQSTHEAVTITRHGRPAAVLMAVDDLESLQETLFWLSQPGIRDDLTEAKREIADGGGLSPEQLRERLRAKRP
jgi:antitoxin YefM